MLLNVTIGRLSRSSVILKKQPHCCVSSENANEQREFMQSVYSESKYIRVVRNQKPRKIYTALVGGSLVYFRNKIVTELGKMWSRKTLDTDTLKEFVISRMRDWNRQKQLILVKDIEELGLDISVARMVCRLGGRVQLAGSSKWIQSYAGISPVLPSSYIEGFLLETIDLSGTNIVYEGLEFLPYLTHLRYLRMKRCAHLDDFCLSRVGRIKGLQFLDVSECPSLTSKGLATLAQLKDLRHLLVSGNPQIEDKELVCLLLEDHLPMVYIDGVDYIGQLSSEAKVKILHLISTNEKPIELQKEETNADEVYLVNKA